jgi:hypothetical protein
MLSNIYNQKVTILNKLKRSDSSSNRDVWYKHTIEDAAWYEESIRSVLPNGVAIGTVLIVLIPFHEDYEIYTEWAKDETRDGKFTMSSGDYIILGDVEEEVTADNVVSVAKRYEGNVCLVKHIKKPHKRFGATVQLRIEGV